MKIDLGWTPRPYDIAWTKNLFSAIADGGLWAIPANGSIWKLDKTKKLITCIHGQCDDMFHKITVCCKSFGWKTEALPDAVAAHQFMASSFGRGKSNPSARPS